MTRIVSECALSRVGQRGKTSFFRASPWFEGIDRGAVDGLVRQTELVAVARGRPVWGPDQPSDRVYWIRSGCVRVERPSGEDRALILRFHGRGDVFGVAALYSTRERGTRAVAHDACALFATPVQALEEVARDHGRLGLRLSDLLIARQRSLEARLAGIVFQPVRDRLLALFAELARDFGVRDSRGVIIDLRLTHREMAALIGATRETVSLTLVRLRRAGCIETVDRRVVLLQPDAVGAVPRERRRRV